MEFKVCASVREVMGNVAHLAVERTNKMIEDQQIALKKERKNAYIDLAKWQKKYEDKLDKFKNTELGKDDKDNLIEETASMIEARLKAQYEAFLAD